MPAAPRHDRDVSGEDARKAAEAIWAIVNHPDYKPVRISPREDWGHEDPRISAAEDARDFPHDSDNPRGH